MSSTPVAPGDANSRSAGGADDAALSDALDWLDGGRAVALATVVATWGSSPRPAGSLLTVNEDGSFSGSVSGGCIEGAVVGEALEVMAGGAPRLLDFGISDDSAWEVGLACGGDVRVFVERVDNAEMVQPLLTARPVARVVDLSTGDHALVDADGVRGPLALQPAVLSAVRQSLAEDRSTRLDAENAELFVAAFNPAARMAIVGAVHVAQALAPMAATAGFDVTVIDPRRAFGTTERFPGVRVVADWPDEALAAMAPDARTVVVTLSHDPKLDDPALEAALRSEAFYIGALGSRKTQAARRERLSTAGFAASDLARIHGPVGLDLGGRKAAEIAVAILAEVIAVRYGRTPTR